MRVLQPEQEDSVLGMLSKSVGSVRHQGHQLSGHAGEVAGNVSGNVLRVLRSHSSTSLTPYATGTSVRPPADLGHRGGPIPHRTRPSSDGLLRLASSSAASSAAAMPESVSLYSPWAVRLGLG